MLGMAAEPELGERAGIGGVLDRDRQLDRFLDQRSEIARCPSGDWARRPDGRRDRRGRAGSRPCLRRESADAPREGSRTVRLRMSMNARGSSGVRHDACSRKRASTPARPTVVVSGRRSTARMPARSTLRCRRRGRRPRGACPMPSVTQPSSISSSMIAETVLGWRPEQRARSARDSGAWRRMKLRAMRRLICLAVPLVARPEVGQVDLAHDICLCREV